MHKSYSKELKEKKLRLKYGVDSVQRAEYASSSESGESSPSHSPPYATSSAPSSPTYTYRTPHYGSPPPEHHGSRSRLYSAGQNREQTSPREHPPQMGAKSSSSGSLLKDLERLRQAQRERGEKLGRVEDETLRMRNAGSVFARTTKALEKKHKDKAKSWWPF